jgi:hypothetical protein
MNHTEAGALAGTALGAVGGAIVGDLAAGRPGAGALIGAATGAIAGGALGSAEDAREERDAAVAHAQYMEARGDAIARAVTEFDVVHMTRNGVGDGVIINAVRTRGCIWDATPEAIIRLKQEGVSEAVIAAMQKSGVRRQVVVEATAPPARYYYYAPPPPTSVVVVGPGYYGPRPWRPRYRGPHFHVGAGYHW